MHFFRRYHSRMPQKTVIGVVLAGGASTRMGCEKAGLVMPDGRRMIDCVIQALQPLCERVVVAGDSPLSQAAEFIRVRDLRPPCGPLGGIEAALASDLGERFLFCACDTPLINTGVLQVLLPPPNDAGGFATAAVFRSPGRERFECLPLYLPRSALHVVRSNLDQRVFALWRVIQSLDPRMIAIDEAQAMLLRNVNTPQEFREIVKP